MTLMKRLGPTGKKTQQGWTPMNQKIMVVDDERGFLREFGEMLNLSGYETVLCENGYEAIDRIRAEQPDMVILDLNMEGLNGFDLAARLRRDPATGDIPMMVVTGELTPSRVSRLRDEAGIERSLKKPFKPLNIICEIENVLKESRGRYA